MLRKHADFHAPRRRLDTHLTGQLGPKGPQTGPPSDAANLLVPTENELTFSQGKLFVPAGIYVIDEIRRIVLRGGSFFYIIENGLRQGLHCEQRLACFDLAISDLADTLVRSKFGAEHRGAEGGCVALQEIDVDLS